MSVDNREPLTRHGRVTSKLPRIEHRPDPAAWKPDELLTLPEAAQLFWPQGPLTTATLRTAARDGQLRVCIIASKHFTSRCAVEEMTRSLQTLPRGIPPGDPPIQQPTQPTTAAERLATLRRIKGR